MGTLTDAWRDAYTDAELAEWIDPPPCMCGHDLDEHLRGGRRCICCSDCDGASLGWIPDRERLCDRCMAGLALDENSPECTKCAGRGWVE